MEGDKRLNKLPVPVTWLCPFRIGVWVQVQLVSIEAHNAAITWLHAPDLAHPISNLCKLM